MRQFGINESVAVMMAIGCSALMCSQSAQAQSARVKSVSAQSMPLPVRTPQRLAAMTLLKQARDLNKALENEEALKLCNQALQTDPTFTEVYLERYQSYRAMDQIDKALADLDILMKNPGLRDSALRGRAEILITQKRYQEALPDINEAISKQPADGLYVMRANVYLKLGKPELAVKDFATAVKTHPQNYGYRCDEARAMLAARQLQPALIKYNKLIAEDEISNSGIPHANLYAERAELYKLLGKPDLAAQDLKQVKLKQRDTYNNSPFRLKNEPGSKSKE